MIKSIIRWSVQNRFYVLLATILLVGFSITSLRTMSVDAIPDLSDIQVIVKTEFPGQAPQVVEDQVTYPLTTALMAVPGAHTVRGFSFFGDSYIYVIFEDDTDLYWARSRVLEYLSQVSGSLPNGVRPTLGPDATGVGWVYIYSLIDRSGSLDLSELRALQDWFLKFELQAIEGVSEIASMGGMVKQYQVIVDPDKLQAYGIPLEHIRLAIQQGNQDVGASVIEQAEAEYLIRASGYIENRDDLLNIPLGLSENGSPLLLQHVAEVTLGPQMRRGVTELNGEGEAVGGIVVMRYGENPLQTIDRVKARLAELETSLPPGVEIIPVYDRSQLITGAVKNLSNKLIEEIIIVSLICIAFLLHLRSALVVIISLPVGVLSALLLMQLQGLNANIMSLGGVALAIGAMVDGAIVMIENLQKRLAGEEPNEETRWQLVIESAQRVGPTLFFSLLIITASFMPVFALEAQEGRMFSPLVFTKTYAMAAAAILTITLVPVLLGYLVRGRIRSEAENPLNRMLTRGYVYVLRGVLSFPRTTIVMAAVVTVLTLWPLSKLGTEFIPPLDEGDLMYMPTTYAGVSIGKAREILQQTNKMIRTVPEVKTVFGKVGRAETATDPAPLTMIETFIQLKPKSEWRPGLTTEALKKELNQRVNLPSLTNAWVMPIKTRIDMLATGIKTPVGIKVSGPNLKTIESIGEQLEKSLRNLPGTASVYSERVSGGRYIDIDINRVEAARFGLNIRDVQSLISTAVGGMNVSQAVEGRERFPINVRYPRASRDSLTEIAELALLTPNGQRLQLRDIATLTITDGPPSIKSENARMNGWTYIDINNTDIASYVDSARAKVNQDVELPPGYSINWSGQHEYIVRAQDRLKLLAPFTLLIIISLLYANFRRAQEVLIILVTLPLATIGGIWLLYLYEYNLSVAVGVGFIALGGVAIEIGMILLTYLNQAFEDSRDAGKPLEEIVIEGAGQRIRPVAMTVIATIAGLLPLMSESGIGSEVMSRMAAPMVGGMVSAFLLTMLILPAIFLLLKRRGS